MNRNKISIFIAVCLSAIIATIIGCSREDGGFPLTGILDSQTIEELKNTLPSEICIFDPSQYFPAETKSAAEDPTMISNEDLDYENAKTFENEKFEYIQIPFHAESPLSNIITYLTEAEAGMINPTPTRGKSFLIKQTSKDSSRTELINVLSILPHPNYMTEGALDSLDFFFNGCFNAIFFYSDLDGRHLKSEIYYLGNLYALGKIVNSYSSSDSVLAIIVPQVEEAGLTRTSDGDYYGGVLEGITVEADRIYPDVGYNNDDPDHPSNNYNNDLNEQVDYVFRPTFGGGKPPVKVIFKTDGDGTIDGVTGNFENSYEPGDVIDVIAYPLSFEISDGTYQNVSEFINWTGDISLYDPHLVYDIPSFVTELSFTAHFYDYKPCSSDDKADPLREMNILGSSGSGIRGGMFGNSARVNKDGSPKKHSGYDFYCPIGTPVYATHSGNVIIREGYVNGEIWDVFKKREPNIDRSIFNCGNVVYIYTKINGVNTVVKYWHLTDVFVKNGSYVEAGQIIGTSGITGNASDKECAGPHLHYQIEQNGVEKDPKDFIYAIINPDTGKNTNPC